MLLCAGRNWNRGMNASKSVKEGLGAEQVRQMDDVEVQALGIRSCVLPGVGWALTSP